MAKFSMEVLPPILESYYPSFYLNSDFTFDASLSAVNQMSDVDHVQVKIFSLHTNKNAINQNTCPNQIYFFDLKSPGLSKPSITVNTNNLFTTESGEAAYGSYYRMQIRFGVSTKNGGEYIYNPAEGQDPADGWDLPKNVTEWSNSAIIKSAQAPEIGIIGLVKDEINEIYNPTIPWVAYYETEDTNETLEQYQFLLYDRAFGNLIEESEVRYIKEYEIPTLMYKFKNILETGKHYTMQIRTVSATGLETTASYHVYPNYPNIKLFNIAKIVENEDEAYNQITIDAKQIILKESKDIDNSCWIKDPRVHELGDEVFTHLKLDGVTLETPDNFGVPYSTFALQLTVKDFADNIQTRLKDAINKPFIRLGNSNGSGAAYSIGAYLVDSGVSFVLVEKFQEHLGSASLTNIYKSTLSLVEGLEEELYFLIKKDDLEVDFEVIPWLTK